MTGVALGLTLGIIAATAVIVAMCCIIVGAAADPARFDRTDELTSDAETQRSVGQRVEGQVSNHFEKESI